jgi:nicotinate-nucleotide pyrophosphorylase (carboxylating)
MSSLDAVIAADVRRALDEDVGGGDLTAALIPAGTHAEAAVISREPAVLCGCGWFEQVFRCLDARIAIQWNAGDGDDITPGRVICTLRGDARALLTGERTALNFMQTLSGTATLTRHCVDIVNGTGVRLLDTRKTIPGLRHAQKYAVACGGGENHRMGLYDAILIKENHIQACGSIALALQTAAAAAPGVPIEIEVENLDQLRIALDAGASRILLDNFSLPDLHEAVRMTQGRADLEASGGIGMETLRAVAQTGVTFISLGALTKNVRAIDLSMRFGN